ncbi:tyrosine-type recombinase/integrase [Halorubrum ezzemoulense]|uniref:tyrosine-type recombinase/integrase n=1 Tax=Halorubrum ezzemoulense TaxID=337243 RepID=UPI00232DCEC0|nr:site-specific integrase [Halorubrum ezzemoulense]MDB2281288.1 tyrosine-type recombinase/integrase [Halorubrum ezzemoulense]
MAASNEDIDPDLLRSLLAEATDEDLEPLSPEDSLEMYVSLREDEVSPSTIRTHRSRLGHFIEWCNENEVENLNDLTGRNLQTYRTWRKQGLSISSLESNMRTLQIYLRKCVKFDAVSSDIPAKVDIPSVSSEENSRDEMISSERVKEILNHLRKYEYASLEHVIWLLLANTGMRIGAVRALDLKNYKSTDQKLVLVHRPDSDTPLKNKEDSEREVDISSHIEEVLNDFMSDKRPDVTDDYGREPLLATNHGRIALSTIRKYAYKWTRPCVITGSCPHGVADDEIDDCKAAQTASKAHNCPGSLSPHPIRRGYITHELDAGIPQEVVSDRCDVGLDIIEEHYDQRSDGEKMRLRKEIREAAYNDTGESGYGQ